MDVVTPLMQTLKAQADIDHTRAVTDDTQALAATRRDQLVQTMLLRQLVPQMFGQMFNNPTGPGAAPQSLPGSPQQPDESEVGQAKRRVGALETQATQFEGFARMIGGIDPKQGMEAAKQAVELRKTAAVEGLGLLRAADDTLKQVGGIATSVVPNDVASLNRAYNQINRVDSRALQPVQFERDAAGALANTPGNFARMQQFGDSSISAAKKYDIQHNLAEEKLRADDIRQRAIDAEAGREERRLDRISRDANTLAAREGVQQRHVENLDVRRENTRISNARLAEEVGKKYLNISEDFSQIKPAFITADKYLFDANGNKTPSTDKTGASDLMLRDAYLKVVHPNFKGSVYELKDIEKLSGLPVRVLQGFKSLTEGKELSEGVRYDMYGAMKAKFKTLNEQQMEQEDAARKRLTAANVEPGMIDAWVPGYALRSKGTAPAAAMPKYQEGQTATGPNGEKAVFRNGQWQTQ